MSETTNPVPGTGPGVALDEDVLRGGAGATDGVDGGLVQLADEGVVLIVELIVSVEDDLLVGGVAFGYHGPPRSEAADVGDDIVIVATEVMRVNYRVCAPVFLR